MLVLSRKEGEQLVIGDNVVITVNRISGNRVAIGIEAPREISIVRGELGSQVNQPKNTGSSQPSAVSAMLERNIAVAGQLDR